MAKHFKYVDGDQVAEYIDQGWEVTFLKYYCWDRLCFLASKEVEG